MNNHLNKSIIIFPTNNHLVVVKEEAKKPILKKCAG
jgi:hypothetical protein